MSRKKGPNPFRPRTMVWALYEEDWSDLTVHQIAEVFASSDESIYAAMRLIKRKTGHMVPHARLSSKGVPVCR